MDLYERRIAALIERTRQINEPWNPTPRKRIIDDIAERIESLAELLAEQGAAQFDIECEHDQGPSQETGPDGWFVTQDYRDPSYTATVLHLRKLAESARRTAKSLPGSRERHALPFAALALLHVRDWHDLPHPTLSNDSEAVRELERVCDAAGLPKSREALRNALSKAVQQFDRHYMPPGISDLFTKF